MKHWIEQAADIKSVKSLESQVDCSKFLAKLLVQRGQKDPVRAQNFINPKLKHLDDPFTIHNMDLAIERIISAREKKEKILLVGDYDVDGITSTVMTKQALESIDIIVDTIIPKRLKRGIWSNQRGLRTRTQKTKLSFSYCLGLWNQLDQ